MRKDNEDIIKAKIRDIECEGRPSQTVKEFNKSLVNKPIGHLKSSKKPSSCTISTEPVEIHTNYSATTYTDCIICGNRIYNPKKGENICKDCRESLHGLKKIYEKLVGVL